MIRHATACLAACALWACATGAPDPAQRAIDEDRISFEESGLLLKRLESGLAFAALCDELDLTLRLDALVPQARWITPTVEKRRYDTRFFLAAAPQEQDAKNDQRETTESAVAEELDSMFKDEPN